MDKSADKSFREVENEHLRSWMKLSTADKVDFFEEMVELAHKSGALAPDRLQLRDLPSKS